MEKSEGDFGQASVKASVAEDRFEKIGAVVAQGI